MDTFKAIATQGIKINLRFVLLMFTFITMPITVISINHNTGHVRCAAACANVGAQNCG